MKELELGLKKELIIISNSGIYILELYCKERTQITHKKFGAMNFAKGYYYYVGSAQKNLYQRIERHKRKEKNLHWHIDYLTTNNNFNLKRIFTFKSKQKKFECILVSEVETIFNLTYPIKHFGNSDCNSCVSHLLFSGRQIDLSRLTM